MRAPLFLLLLLPLLQSPVFQHASGSELNVRKDEQSMPNFNTFNISSTDQLSSGIEAEETKDNVKEVRESQFLVNDAGREKPPIKNPANLDGGKKNPNKPKRKGHEKKTKRKIKTPCEGKYKGFCVHGECRYIEQFLIPVCTCHPDYFGERCVEQFLKTKRTNNETSVLKIEVVVASVFFAVVSFAIIIIIITEQVRKKCTNYNEIEERRNLKKENGIPSSNV
ncbi:amphiregulin isoform X1 [Crotalus tigris]|uniref:amphiregulin isoform X1 n=1 Tax=Crotalus tigris TaxID=88082 RepID=UPI00192F4DB9|nr:amphiregulin isoform X1 [Crotalus tigris]